MRWLVALLMILVVATPVRAQPCCGPITAEGEKLRQFLDQSDVVHRWLSGWHVDWETGATDRPEPGGYGGEDALQCVCRGNGEAAEGLRAAAAGA